MVGMQLEEHTGETSGCALNAYEAALGGLGKEVHASRMLVCIVAVGLFAAIPSIAGAVTVSVPATRN